MKKLLIISLVAILALTGCTNTSETISETATNDLANEIEVVETEETADESETITLSDLFTDRDLEQDYDTEDAIEITLENNQDITIDTEGVYLITGQVINTSILVDTEDKVQLVLDNVEIINDNQAVINVVSADKVFITNLNDNHLEVTSTFSSNDSVIYSKSDLVLNGSGALTVVSTEGNGVTSKDDLKITGSRLTIESKEDALEANDSIRVYAGDITIDSDKDALHSENEDDESLGYIYIYGGTFNINAADDGIRATSLVQIDGGNITIENCMEGIEATYVLINDGAIEIYSEDDGINATAKSSMEVAIEVTGGNIDITMASGDTDGFDSNGNLYISGGTINVDAVSAFDADGDVEFTGGMITVNGEEITEITMTQPGRTKPNGN